MSPPRRRPPPPESPAAAENDDLPFPGHCRSSNQIPRAVALLSDVHGNLPAFEAVLADSSRQGVDEIWCLGDLVGYGAQPDECVALAARALRPLPGRQPRPGRDRARSTSPTSRRARRPPPSGRRSTSRARRSTTSAGSSPPDESRAIGLYHASPRDPVWEYVLSTMQAERCMDAMGPRVGAVGHSHVALFFHAREGMVGRASRPPPAPSATSPTGAGSSTPAAWASRATATPGPPGCSSTPSAGPRSWRRVEYPIDDAARAIQEAGLPQVLADRLYAGQ